jgi:PAS domain S-box-containing protein
LRVRDVPWYRQIWAQYGFAIAGVAAVTLLRFPLESVLQGRAPYALFYLPILITAWSSGVGPTVVSAVLSLIAVWFFFIPHPGTPGDSASMVLFAIVSGAMVVLAKAAARIRWAAERARESAHFAQAAAGAAERAQAHLAAIVESSDDAIISKNLDGIIRSWNAGAQRLFGYAADEIVGKPITTLIPRDRQSEEAGILKRLGRGERVEHYETVRITKDGRLVDVSLSISPVRDESGKIVGASKIARDITERKRAAEELAAQKEWLQVTLQSIGDAVIATDREGRVMFLNHVAEKLTGFAAKEAEGAPIGDVFRVVNEETRKPVGDLPARIIQSGHAVGLGNHTVLISRDGAEYPIADSAAPIFDLTRRIIGVVIVFHDVTEERRAVEALAEQREWFQTTLHSIGDAVIATDSNGNVVFMNPVAEHLTGWKSAAAQGLGCAEVFRIVNEQTRTPVENPVARVLREGIVVGLANHTVLLGADGVERPIDDSGAPIRGLDGRILGAVLVFRDVTERRRAEDQKSASLAERERLLESERLARAEAERANRLKDDFVATVSHELRTPLNAILGWAQLLTKRQPDSQTLRHGIDVIERNTRIQAHLISDLLDLSRIISGKLRLELEPVNLADVVIHAIQTIKPSADAKRIEIRQVFDGAIPDTVGDPARLQQIVLNLLSNAVKFTLKEGTVTVTLRRIDSHAEIAVSDSGVGIRPEILPFLFDRFRQGDTVMTRRFGGLGLGLAITKQLAEAHGGIVSAFSEGEGKGATFAVRLPISSLRPPARDLDSEAERTLAGVGNKLENVRVLVVEDEPDTRELMLRLLQEYRAQVTTASSALEALELFAARPPQILVSDIGLPDVDGYELMRRIRKMEHRHGGVVPAIAVTAFARSEDRTRALQAGYHAHVAKPVEPAELIATVASFVDLVDDDSS